MDQLPREIFICIAEKLPASDLNSLMVTNKSLQALISCYSKSIAKNSARYWYPGHPERLLSSAGVIRRAIDTESFHGLAELERRQKRVDAAITGHVDRDAPMVCNECKEACGNYGRGASCEDIFKRSLFHCDAMADLAVSRDGATGIFNALTPRPSLRAAQIRYIQSLPLHDLQSLHALNEFEFGEIQALLEAEIDAEIGGGGGGGGGWVKDSFACLTLLQEMVLRHGSWFLWLAMEATTRRDAEIVDTFVNLLSDGMRELERWESGDPGVPDGLVMTANCRSRELLLRKMAETEADAEAREKERQAKSGKGAGPPPGYY